MPTIYQRLERKGAEWPHFVKRNGVSALHFVSQSIAIQPRWWVRSLTCLFSPLTSNDLLSATSALGRFRRIPARKLHQVHNLPEPGLIRFLDNDLLSDVRFLLRQQNLTLLVAELNRALFVFFHNSLPWQKSPRRIDRRSFNPADASKSRS